MLLLTTQLSWTALIENRGSAPVAARADADLEVLGLEIRGGKGNASQTLAVEKGVSLTGRNEVRVSANGALLLAGGRVVSLRWVEIGNGGRLAGHGSISADVYSSGSLVLSPGGTLEVSGDYRETPGASLKIAANGMLQVKGEAVLRGKLEIDGGVKLEPGKPHKILTAAKISGTFGEDDVVAVGGQRFSVGYTDTQVTLTALK